MNTTLRNVAIVVLVMIVFMARAEWRTRKDMRRVLEFLKLHKGQVFTPREITHRTGVSPWDIHACLGHLQEQGHVNCMASGPVAYFYVPQQRTEPCESMSTPKNSPNA